MCRFLRKLRLKQRENFIVDSIADILIDFFSNSSGQQLKCAYGEFCANHQKATETFKEYLVDPNFREWHKHKQGTQLLSKKGISESILFVVQRLTKHQLIIEALIKSTKSDPIELEKLERALELVKEVLNDVNRCVAEKQLDTRRMQLFQSINANSSALYRNQIFKKSDIVERKLK